MFNHYKLSENVPRWLRGRGFVAQRIILQVCSGGSRNCESSSSFLFSVVFNYNSKFFEYLTPATWSLSATVAACLIFICSPRLLCLYLQEGWCVYSQKWVDLRLWMERYGWGYLSFWRSRALHWQLPPQPGVCIVSFLICGMDSAGEGMVKTEKSTR